MEGEIGTIVLPLSVICVVNFFYIVSARKKPRLARFGIFLKIHILGFLCVLLMAFLLRSYPGFLPKTSVTLYFLLTINAACFTLFASLGFESPTAKLSLLLSKGPMKLHKIFEYFQDKDIIGLRLEDLEHGGLITRHGKTYTVTALGKQTLILVSIMEKYMKWKNIG